MERKNEKQKGITLIALVITIIVLLILAGVTIGFLSGEDGLISRITKSIDTGKIEDYKEVIELDRLGTEILAGTKDMTDEEYMDNYENDLKKDAENGNLKGSTVTRKDEGTVRVVTPEGYVFDATREGVEYVGKQGEEDENLPEIEDADIDISYEPSGWTNGEVTVTIKLKEITLEDGYYLQYSVNDEGWKNYEKEFKVEDNETTIYARVVNELGDSKGVATGTVKNIDKANPEVNEDLTAPESTTSSITLSTTLTDELSGLGKIIWYYKESGEENYQQKEEEYTPMNEGTAGSKEKETKTYKLEGLKAGTTYNMYAEVYDVAGNKTRTPEESGIVDKTTVGMTDEEIGTITVTPSTTDWTNEDVTFTITTTANTDIFKLQYTTDLSSEWKDLATNPNPKLTENGTMYARLVEIGQPRNVSSDASSTIDKIDKTAPTIDEQLSGVLNGTSSIALSTVATDIDSGLGKII